MMTAKIIPGSLKGVLKAPSSKSFSQRLLALSLLHKGTTIIKGIGQSEDEQAALAIIRQSGAAVSIREDGAAEIVSAGMPSPEGVINCGESALALRMFATILAISDKEFEMKGAGTLLNRPVGLLADFLPGLGVSIITNEGFLPLQIKGPLHARDISIDGSQSSQYLSGLLIALSAVCTDTIHVNVKNPVSNPYTDLTIHLIEKFGGSIERTGYSEYIIRPGRSTEDLLSFDVEGDWSNAAFWLVAGVLAGDIELTGLDIHSFQGDKIVLEVLRMAGAEIDCGENSIIIKKSSSLRSFEFDATHYPDLFPPLAILAAVASGTSRIKGLGRLADKESNRALGLSKMLKSFGIHSTPAGDELIVEGGKIRGGNIDAGNDHRMVMAASVAAMVSDEPVEVRHAGAVAKSYPSFFEDLRSLGACVSLNPEIHMA